MQEEETELDYKPSYFASVLTNKCPRCRQGNMFKTRNAYNLKEYMLMNEECPVCGQPTEVEVGFYYGTAYVSYAITVAFSVATFIAWWVLIGFSLDDNRIFWWLGINSFFMLALQPVFMRLSRSIWLSWFVKYDPEWRTHKASKNERVIDEHKGNW